MSGPPLWRKLVDDLRASGHQSTYLDRLKRGPGKNTGQQTLEMEIVQEMASALGRAEDKVNVALLRLELIEREIAALEDARGTGETLAAKIDAFNAQRQLALEARNELAIHREAIGFRNDERFDALYPVPPRRAQH